MEHLKKHFKQILNIYLYAIDKESYEIIKPRFADENRKNVLFFSAMSFFALMIMYGVSFFAESLKKNSVLYLASAIGMCILFHLCFRFGKKHSKVVYICVYIFIVAIFAFGIALGTFIEDNEQVTVSYVLILFAVPLLFLDVPVRLCMFMALSIVIYCICARYTQSDTLFGYNMSNVIPYGFLSMVISLYIMRIKAERLYFNDKTKKLSEQDQMTHMNNRRLYEERLSKIGDDTKNISVVALDINGLKMINDNLGHAAGDELIEGAAREIIEVFGKIGDCYRTGGDEFMVIMENNTRPIDELIQDVKKRCLEYKGEYVTEISISVGAIVSDGEKNISELVQIADRYMYEDKAEHYRTSNPNLDKLTGLLNRKSGEEQIDRLLSSGETGILYVMKVSDISSIYETKGSDEGNAILIQIAKQLKTTFREYDVVARSNAKTFMIFAKSQNPTEVINNIIVRIKDNVIKTVYEDDTHAKPDIMLGMDYVTMHKYKSFPELYENATNSLKSI